MLHPPFPYVQDVKLITTDQRTIVERGARMSAHRFRIAQLA